MEHETANRLSLGAARISPAVRPPTALQDSVCNLLNTTYLASDLALGLPEGYGEILKAEPGQRLYLDRLQTAPAQSVTLMRTGKENTLCSPNAVI